MKKLWQVRRAALVRALPAIALSTTHKAPSKQTTDQRLAQRSRSIGTAALVACAFLLTSFAAQAQIAMTTTLVSSKNPSTSGDSVTFTATVSSNGNGVPTQLGPLLRFFRLLSRFWQRQPYGRRQRHGPGGVHGLDPGNRQP